MQQKSKKGIAIGIIAVVVVVIIVIFGWYFGTKNNLVRMEESVNGAYAKIDTQLQRRYDLIPNLVNTVKGYDIHEKEVIDSVTEARAQIGSASTPADRIDAENQLNGALSRLLMVVENYPDLKADANYRQLMDELAGAENRISVARTDYNEEVQAFNAKIRSFPNSMVAGNMGLESMPYFEADSAAKTAPTVDFTKP